MVLEMASIVLRWCRDQIGREGTEGVFQVSWNLLEEKQGCWGSTK